MIEILPHKKDVWKFNSVGNLPILNWRQSSLGDQKTWDPEIQVKLIRHDAADASKLSLQMGIYRGVVDFKRILELK